MFHFLNDVVFCAPAPLARQRYFEGAERDHLALAAVKAQELRVVFALFQAAARVQRFIRVVRRNPAAFSLQCFLYAVPIVFSAADRIEIEMHKGGNVSRPGGTADAPFQRRAASGSP